MFLSRNKKINVYPCKRQFYCIKVGIKVYRHVFAVFNYSFSFTLAYSRISHEYSSSFIIVVNLIFMFSL